MRKFWCKKCGEQHSYYHMCFRDGSSRRFQTKKLMETLDTRHITVRFMERLRGIPQLASLIPENAELERIYRSRDDREEGAWAWRVNNSDIDIGSKASMTECFKAKDLHIVFGSHIELIPSN